MDIIKVIMDIMIAMVTMERNKMGFIRRIA